LLGGLGERFPRVGGFGGGEADEFRSAIGECGVDEDGAKALEAL